MLPPGPPFSLLTTLRFLRDPFALLGDCARRYGDPFTLRLLFGTMVVTGHPDGVREIMTADPEQLSSNNGVMRPLLGDASLLLVSGARHKRDRKLLAPPFHGARMKTYGKLVTAEALAAFSRAPRDAAFSMQKIGQEISLRVILRAIFGVEDEARAARLSKAITKVTEDASPILLFVPALRISVLGVGPWAKFLRARAEYDSVIFAEIAERRREEAGGEGREDVLGLLLSLRDESGVALDDREVRDELTTFFFAGHESTALAIAWLFFETHLRPGIRDRLRWEISSLGESPDPDRVNALPFLDACCKETLRLHPLVPQVSRKLHAPLTVRGFEVPAGASAAASLHLAHQREEAFPEPRRFNPDRFLEKNPGPFEFIPFGGGARRCIGASFALYEMKLVFAAAMSRYEFSCGLDRELRTVRSSITMGPEDGAPMRILRAV